MDNPWIAAAVALFLWWFSTGILLWRVRAADNGGHDQHIWSCLLSLPLLAAGVIGVNETLNDASTQGVYIAFLSALAIWAWIELAFLSGLITGPNREPCPPHATDWERFLRGFGTLAWHELALVAALTVLAQMSDGAANSFALWTFAVLFFARVSAKLNLFFGVPRIHTEFLPRTLSHLPAISAARA
jgi:putative photosynthetic complex assembly protein 2